jgi:hypothetical protein
LQGTKALLDEWRDAHLSVLCREDKGAIGRVLIKAACAAVRAGVVSDDNLRMSKSITCF